MITPEEQFYPAFGPIHSTGALTIEAIRAAQERLLQPIDLAAQCRLLEDCLARNGLNPSGMPTFDGLRKIVRHAMNHPYTFNWSPRPFTDAELDYLFSDEP